ncbi:hypothetical protein [Terrisporobacter hibernicus]|uniref:Uncharacterized protein n=1 Tax=Terrisporobacter hibernicus TaxID=2813371 RepID=A0AAX2ZGM3_9FIRM|nr:hypothetical protein [Terrisporobacter hibernicus]UEL48216.1 hypothetical protein JW646_01835 [Terrisporobacter hibernicus]
MFNSGYKKEALADLEKANKKYEKEYNLTVKDIEILHKEKVDSLRLIKSIENYFNSLSNKPKELIDTVNQIKLNYTNFEKEIRSLELESKKAEKVSGSVAGAGVAAGVGVAAFGPSTAMAVAMTFGTASTGTAISALSGAAATNAALAWLGGGALVAGGGGMGAGGTFLALAGPVGWAIGGAGVIGGGALANKKNKEIARKAENATCEVKKETTKISKVHIKVNSIKKEINDICINLKQLYERMSALNITNCRQFNSEQLANMKILINTTESLSRKINEKVS